MRNNREYIAVSVESRKGGVGKTTVALNLGRCCRAGFVGKKHEVIYLDLDMSGTKASETVAAMKEQQGWGKMIRAVEDGNGEALNLVKMFESYMTGENALKQYPKWRHQDDKENGGIVLKSGMINVFSSFIDRPDPDKEDGKKENSHRYGPAALFDEIHSAWFIEMLREIVDSCIVAYKKHSGHTKGILVIIDNAPGWSGLEPAIEEWLTDMGPDCGKFLFVSSMDSQDITASLESLVRIHGIYARKWKAAKLLRDAAGDTKQTIASLKKREKQFFRRLFETAPAMPDKCWYSDGTAPAGDSRRDHKTCTGCGLCYYRKIDVITGEKNIKSASGHLAIVINRDMKDVYKNIGGGCRYSIGKALCKLGITLPENTALGDIEEAFYSVDEYQDDVKPIIGIIKTLNKRRIKHHDILSLQFLVPMLRKFTSEESDFNKKELKNKKDKVEQLKQEKDEVLKEIRSFDYASNINDVESCLKKRFENVNFVDFFYSKILSPDKDNFFYSNHFKDLWNHEYYASTYLVHFINMCIDLSGYRRTRPKDEAKRNAIDKSIVCMLDATKKASDNSIIKKIKASYHNLFKYKILIDKEVKSNDEFKQIIIDISIADFILKDLIRDTKVEDKDFMERIDIIIKAMIPISQYAYIKREKRAISEMFLNAVNNHSFWKSQIGNTELIGSIVSEI